MKKRTSSSWINAFKPNKENITFTLAFVMFFYAYNWWISVPSNLEYSLSEFIQFVLIVYVIFSLGNKLIFKSSRQD